MRFPDNFIDQVQTASDIVEVISQVLPLKRAGRNYKAHCPFHQEKTASFMVHPEKQIFHCFGCGAGGNVFAFLMRHDNVAFPEVVKELAERAHIPIPQVSGQKSAADPASGEKEKLFEIYRAAADFYHGIYLDPKCGEPARQYFYKRGYAEETAREFKLGWALDGWRNLFEHLVKKGYSENLILRSGLVHRSPKGQCYDVFRGRFLFPISNLQGKVVAFGGRLLGEGEGPKYLNSPENPIFQKRKELFGLHLAKKSIDRDRPRILIVEGYFDFLGLYAAGFKETVATLGTALSEDHIAILKRFAEEAIMVYDGDKAGEAASLRGLEIFLEGGMNVKIVRLPLGFDPDDFVRKYGAEAFRGLIETAQDIFDFKMDVLTKRFNRNDSLGLMKITQEAMETLARVRSPVLAERYLSQLGSRLGIHEQALRTELLKIKKKTADHTKPETPLPPVKSNLHQNEILILALAFDVSEFYTVLSEELVLEDFSDPACCRLYQILRTSRDNGEKLSWPQLLSRVEDDRVREKLTEISCVDWSSEAKEKAFRDCIDGLHQRKVKRRLEDLRREIDQAERSGDLVRLGRITQEYQALWRQKVV